MKKDLLHLYFIVFISVFIMTMNIYENKTTPCKLADQTSSFLKKGSATCKSYLGVVDIGDCGYQAALKNGKISKVHHHDIKKKGWFFYKTITTNVYGE